MDSTRTPSQSALSAATARAAHLLVDDEPVIFADTLARTLLGADAETRLDYHRRFPTAPVLAGARAEAVCRSRFTEDRLAASRCPQYVILGAGLDTYAYRTTETGSPVVFEVDHPASQQAKRTALAAAGVREPSTVRYVPADLEVDDVLDALRSAGLDPTQPTFVSWLGVVMYLTRDAVERTARMVAGLGRGTELVADYLLAPHLRDDAAHAYVDAVGPVVAASGESWRSFFAPDDLTDLCARAGFATVRHVRQRESVDPALWQRTDTLHPMHLSGIAQATV